MAAPPPPSIRRLDETVVNRIAAGEVVQRPANGLKELLENSLDAKATSVSVVMDQGGLKTLQVTDNGTGIRREDMGILCERFTTSKLREFSDLASIATFGFRGEALASISHVARLRVVTKTADSKCGYSMSYLDGKPVDPAPKPCAANQGTQITAEDLFYNAPTRRRVLKSPSEEANRIADVVSKYAIHNSGVTFSLRSLSGSGGGSGLEVRTQAQNSVADNVACVYGSAAAKELVPLEVNDEVEGPLRFSCRGMVSGVNYNSKRAVFLLFINNRLVESSALKKAVDMVYASYLPKGTHPFVYLSLDIDPANVDVNVHPTKHEVHFLHQDEIVEVVQRALDAKLLSGNSSRLYFAQALLPGAVAVAPVAAEKAARKSASSADAGAPEKPLQAKDMVRTDAKEQKIDKFVVAAAAARPDPDDERRPPPTSDRGHKEPDLPPSLDDEDDAEPERPDEEACNALFRREIRLTSLKHLRQLWEGQNHRGLRELVANHYYVGAVDRRLALVQHGTGLYLADTRVLSRHLFYQTLLQDFGNFDAIRLSPPVSLRDLALIALDSRDSGWTESDGPKSELADFVVELLQSKAEMLDDYFTIEVDSEGRLCALPMLLKDYVPFLGGLPMLVLRFSTEVNWEDEEQCLENICDELARFYAISEVRGSRFDADQHQDPGSSDGGDDGGGCEGAEGGWAFTVEHVVYPAIKKRLFPPKSCSEDTTFVQVANLPDLYKVFERC